MVVGEERRGSPSFVYLLAGKEEKLLQPSRAPEQGREPEKVIASLSAIPEKPLICVSANFEVSSNLDKL